MGKCNLCGDEKETTKVLRGEFEFCDVCAEHYGDYPNLSNYVVYYENVEGVKTDAVLFMDADTAFEQFFYDVEDANDPKIEVSQEEAEEAFFKGVYVGTKNTIKVYKVKRRKKK